uniref:Uncharacterized protein n=1 Tax=Oryza glumipatula TaxID=40148 RepID=A0A0E0AY57_9ORYZ
MAASRRPERAGQAAPATGDRPTRRSEERETAGITGGRKAEYLSRSEKASVQVQRRGHNMNEAIVGSSVNENS